MKRLIPVFIKDFIKSQLVKQGSPDIFSLNSYSQEGEDLILNRFFEGKNSGFFIDIGAHHPIRFSNTYLFYKKGWRGINIDAMPESMRLFEMERPEDINIEQAIGSENKDAMFHIFNEPALNTFDPNEAKNVIDSGKYTLEKKMNLPIKTLSQVIDQLHIKSAIDFISIDVEGLDLEVLEGNDWDKYRPTVILIELLNFELENANEHKTVLFLRSKGYQIFAKTFNTVFFKTAC